MSTVLIVLLVTALLARWVAQGVGARAARPELGDAQAEVARLREEVDALSAEVRRLSDEQSFLVRLLGAPAESPPNPAPAPGGAPNQESP